MTDNETRSLPVFVLPLALVAICSVLVGFLVWIGFEVRRQQYALEQAVRQQEADEQAQLDQQELARQEEERQAREVRPFADCRRRIQQLTEVVDAYKLNNGEYPTSLQALLQQQPRGGQPFLGGRGDLLDPWGKPMQYDPSGPNNGGKRPDIWTNGPKGKIGNWPVQPAGPQ
jgi:hypothetical protein